MSDVAINTSTTQTSSSFSSSGSTSSSSKSLLRLNGMASGLDVDSIVTQMMTPYQNQIDKVKQDIQRVQWKQSMYQNIISDAKEFQNTYFNNASLDMNITSSKFFNAMTASSATSDVTVSANSDAAAGNYKFVVNNLAQNAKINGKTLNTQISVSDFAKWSSATTPGKISFSTDGSTDSQITLEAGDTDALSVVSNINRQIAKDTNLSGKITASYLVQGTGESAVTYIKFSSASGSNVKMTGSNISDINSEYSSEVSGSYSMTNKDIVSINLNTKLSQLGFTGSGTLKLNCNNTTLNVNTSSADETLGQLIADISKESSGQVVAKIDDITGEFVIQTSKTGSNSTLSITNENPSADSLLNALGLSSGSFTDQGADARVSVNGTAISESSNSFTLNGVNFNLVNAGQTEFNVTVSSNTDSLFTKFKGFIDKYNSLVTEIRSKVNEKVTFDYPPLTDSQKKQMSDSDIASWNDKAKSGLLHNDNNLQNMLQGLKNTFYDAISGAGLSFGSGIGIDLSNDYSKDGTLAFTDGTGDTFKKTIKEHGTELIGLFTMDADATKLGTDKYNNEGISDRINDILINNVGMTGVTSTSSILGKMALKQENYSVYGSSGSNTFLDQIFQYNNRIKTLQESYTSKQTQFYAQFTALEQAMSRLNSQSSMISQLIGGQSNG